MRNLFWFRHDLRLQDNTGFSAACRAGEVVPCVILDDAFLKNNPAIGPNRCALFVRAVDDLARNLAQRGVRLIIRHGKPEAEIPRLFKEARADEVYFNRDYEPYAVERDRRVGIAVRALGGNVTTFKDLVVFESTEILTNAGNPHLMFSHFRKSWLKQPSLPSVRRLPAKIESQNRLKLSSVQLETFFVAPESRVPEITEAAAQARLREFMKRAVFDYAAQRDRPGIDGTSRLSPHLKFGTLSPRTALAAAHEKLRGASRAQRKNIETFIDELIWRDYFFNIMSAFPQVAGGAFRRKYKRIKWKFSPRLFRAWQDGRTGFPIVDAGMRQLQAIGWMHNRVRMITASFLCKDLLIDWRRGERHFSRLLIDGEFAVNNGNWQWVAGTGADAQPYFRIFNPQAQGKRFDPDGAYVRQWVPELACVPNSLIHEPWKCPELCPNYPSPIIDHARQRDKALALYSI